MICSWNCTRNSMKCRTCDAVCRRSLQVEFWIEIVDSFATTWNAYAFYSPTLDSRVDCHCIYVPRVASSSQAPESRLYDKMFCGNSMMSIRYYCYFCCYSVDDGGGSRIASGTSKTNVKKNCNPRMSSSDVCEDFFYSC